jgi:hypothetical protein
VGLVAFGTFVGARLTMLLALPLYLGVGFAVFCLIAIAGKLGTVLFSRAPVLEADSRGILSRSTIGFPDRVPWRDIVAIETRGTGRQEALLVSLRDSAPRSWVARLLALVERARGVSMLIPQAVLDQPVADIADTLRTLRDR